MNISKSMNPEELSNLFSCPRLDNNSLKVIQLLYNLIYTIAQSTPSCLNYVFQRPKALRMSIIRKQRGNIRFKVRMKHILKSFIFQETKTLCLKHLPRFRSLKVMIMCDSQLIIVQIKTGCLIMLIDTLKSWKAVYFYVTLHKFLETCMIQMSAIWSNNTIKETRWSSQAQSLASTSIQPGSLHQTSYNSKMGNQCQMTYLINLNRNHNKHIPKTMKASTMNLRLTQ